MTGADGSESHPFLAALIAGGMMAGVIVFWWLAARVVPRKASDWDVLAVKFPPNGAHKSGERYRRCTGSFGEHRGGNIDNAFLIEFAQEGLLVTANFARHLPILVPWPAIREVQTVDPGFLRAMVIVTVDYEKTMRFHLPREAMAGLQQNVARDRVREPTTFYELISKRFYSTSK